MRPNPYDNNKVPLGIDLPQNLAGKTLDHASKFSGQKPPRHCARLQSRFIAYLDGDLTNQERQAVQAHLEVCPFCRQELQVCQSSEQMLMQAQQALPLAGDLRTGFYARLAEENRSLRKHSAGKINWRTAFPALAACALVIGLLDGRFRAPVASIAISTSSENRVAGSMPTQDLLKRNNTIRDNMMRKLGSPPQGTPVDLPHTFSKVAAARQRNSPENRFGWYFYKPKALDTVRTASETKAHASGYWRRTIAAARSFAASKATAATWGLALPSSAKLQNSGSPMALAYASPRQELNSQVTGLNAKLTTDHDEAAKDESQRAYLYDSQQTTRRSFALGLPARDDLNKFGRITSRISALKEDKAKEDTEKQDKTKEVKEDDGVNFQVRDTQRGFTSEMRLASQVEVHNGREVLTIHLEDNDDSLPKTDSKPIDEIHANQPKTDSK